MRKIAMTKPLAEMQGDEMTRILWDWIKELLIEPFVDLRTEFYDLSIQNRDATDDRVTIDAANAVKRLRVGVKCATITPNAERVREYSLKKMWASPNGTIRAILDGTVFRAPIIVRGITPFVPGWNKPITIARHAYGDVYKDVEAIVPQGSIAKLVVADATGKTEKVIFEFSASDGIVLGMHNTDKSIYSFARSCFNYALSVKQDLWFATKDTISKLYDGRFKDIFESVFNSEYKTRYEEAGIKYEYSLIDDSVARVMKSGGGFVWALKNYDGDVMSDMVATAFGSLAMMTSVLVSPDGCYEYEAAHGTVTRHYYKYKSGVGTSTNSVAMIFAWTGALRKHGELDQNADLCEFADKLEQAVISTIENGTMTGDLSPLFSRAGITPVTVDSRSFLQAIADNLRTYLN